MAGLLNFVLIQKPGWAQQNKQGKPPLSPALSGTFWRLNVATLQLAGIKNWNFAISPLLHFAPANTHTHTHIYFLWKNQEITRKYFFLQIRMMSFNSSLLLTNHIKYLPWAFLHFFAPISNPVTIGSLCPSPWHKDLWDKIFITSRKIQYWRNSFILC